MAKEKANGVTIETQGGTNFSGAPNVVTPRKDEIVRALQSYMREADTNRKGGENPRDEKWEDNLNLYWNRWDFSDKQAWQAKEAMPEVPAFVDRFAAAMKEALVATPDGFFSVKNPADTENDVSQAIKNIMDVMLTSVGRTPTGQLLPFSAVFEEQMKLGSLMATSAVVTWKKDYEDGRVAIEPADPRMVWLDHTGRNLYRIRRTEVDRHELAGMQVLMDGSGKAIYNLDEVMNLQAGITEKQRQDRERTGTGQEIVSGRQPVILDEYVATIVGDDGKVIADRSLMVMANEQYLIRGPEANPFWHGKDFLVYAPLILAPMSPYGRSYMEDFGSVASTFNELTNLIIDAVHASSLNAFAMVPGMLANPNQISDGIRPSKVFLLEDGFNPKEFAEALKLGTLPPEAVKVWEMMKSELANAAGINEIGLGQFAPNSRTSATEITETQQSSSALIRSVAQTVETRWLDPTLDLVWKTGLQFAKTDNKMFAQAAGEDMWNALYTRRKELIKAPISFQARGISSLISRNQGLKSLMGILQVLAQNETLMGAFLKKIDLNKLIDRILTLSGVDMSKFVLTEREKMVQDLANPMQQMQQDTANAPQPSPQGDQAVQGVVNAMGAGK